ncbi:LysR family transcriptional regulator [Acinetobacter bereziniae]|uniref:LysR family transcriptional regulator n=1 Tax=Acinetobacter bereziniae TaxID=106648 RepID=UPI001D190017|nr:LysR family transcriptional regulator [Acinetobacter bereziniae]MDG3558407.1 LysR family transcriptional regulator [Acinetobacter bereziniae]MDP6003900.1 LysR family transcriptional regulator [Acinetobacter bereziniae]UUN95768.1 LysR family transcriptional regulator [Acinetobacter bereziniae]WMW76757.1 LysR family transcriptional regulator [Acinetobacter bereziniae]
MDLSLIKVFVIIFETKNISHAAERLNLSQPSVTYNLNRLRKSLNDPLFERDKFGVKPTKLAQSLYPSFRQAISDIEMAIIVSQRFDPKTSTRAFRLGLSDLGEFCLLPSLIQHLVQEAPFIKIEIEEIQSDKVEEWLVEGFLDAAVFNSSYTVMPKIESRNLFEERYMCIADKNHPRVREQLSLEQYLQEKHAAIKSSTGHIEIDQKLKELGLKRKIMLELPHFSVLQDVVNSSELLVTLPSRAAKVYERNSDVNSFELPFSVKPFNVSVNWYNHRDDLDARTWFIQTLQQLFQLL